jgi:sarcosine oxidase subunit alpha
MVPLAADGALVQVHPRRVVVATGTIEVHPVFPGNDLPGVMLGRAASMLAAHGVRAGARAVVVVSHEAGLAHVETMLDVGVRIAALAVPRSLADRAPEGLRILVDAEVVRAEGTDRLRFAVLRDADGIVRGIGCDAFVLSVGLEPRDDLLRTAAPHEAVEAVGGAAGEPPALPSPAAGVVCLCEDVSGTDLARAWREGFRGTELLKRYSTTTMGPCQGAMCGRHLAAFAAARGAARPPVRPVPLGVLAAAVHEVVERRTGLHDLHVEAGARIGWSGGWLRPFHYGDWREEHRAVRERVSLLDVGTLAKHLVTGPDAATLLDVTVATRVRDQPAGTARYVLVLDEAGYVVDDGLLSLLPDGDRYLTTTSGGAARIEATLRDRVERFGLRANVVELTGERGAILVAGPRARELLARVTEGPSGLDDLRPMGVSDLTVCGVPCLAIRSGFVGEVAIELHHPRSRGPALWRSLLRAGEDLGIRPHGLDALEVLRLEKGHVYMGQDSLPDDTPEKLGLGWAVDVHKRAFLGKRALERLRAMPLDRKLVGLAFDRGDAGLRGLPLIADGIVIGRVTSAAESPTLVRTIGLGWVRRAHDGSFPTEVRAGRIRAAVVPTTFLDPEGARLHG